MMLQMSRSKGIRCHFVEASLTIDVYLHLLSSQIKWG